jgi:hypothetical protein
VTATIATDIPLDRLSTLRVRSAIGVDPLSFGTEDRPLSLGTGAARVLLPQSFGFRPSSTDPAIAVVDNSEGADDPTHPPTLRRVARIPMMSGDPGEVLLLLHHGCLANVTPPSGQPACPGGMTTCTVSQWCEGQGLTCGNDGCCRSIDITAADIVQDAGYADVMIPPTTETSASSCIPFANHPDGGTDAGADASTDASADARTDATVDASGDASSDARSDVPGG